MLSKDSTEIDARNWNCMMKNGSIAVWKWNYITIAEADWQSGKCLAYEPPQQFDWYR